MMIQPAFPKDPFDLIKTGSNIQFANILISNGAKRKDIRNILEQFYSHEVVLQDVYKHANNPEWLQFRAGLQHIEKQYDKAIKNLKELMADGSIFSSTREQLITKDIGKLEHSKNDMVGLLTGSIGKILNSPNSLTKSELKPVPSSTHQMLVFQSWALYKYLNNFKGVKTNNDIYCFILELLQNIYNNTILDQAIKNLTVESLKKNFIDNADHLRKKYNTLETIIISMLPKRTS